MKKLWVLQFPNFNMYQALRTIFFLSPRRNPQAAPPFSFAPSFLLLSSAPPSALLTPRSHFCLNPASVLLCSVTREKQPIANSSPSWRSSNFHQLHLRDSSHTRSSRRRRFLSSVITQDRLAFLLRCRLLPPPSNLCSRNLHDSSNSQLPEAFPCSGSFVVAGIKLCSRRKLLGIISHRRNSRNRPEIASEKETRFKDPTQLQDPRLDPPPSSAPSTA